MPATKRAFFNKSLTALVAVVAVSAAIVAGNPAVAGHIYRHSDAVASTKVLATAAHPQSAARSRNNAWWTNRTYPPAAASTINILPTAAKPRSAARSPNNAWWTNRTYQ